MKLLHKNKKSKKKKVDKLNMFVLVPYILTGKGVFILIIFIWWQMKKYR